MRLRSTRGYTLVELLLVLSIGLMLLGATTTTFVTMINNSAKNNRREESADAARRALDVQARQLRNVAQRYSTQPVIVTLGSYDIAFQTTDPARTWVRYCLDTTRGTSNGRLWEGISTANTPPAVGSCPSTAWTNSVVTDNVVNKIGGRDRPLFQYYCAGGGTACTTDTTKFDQLLGVQSTLYLDTTPTATPPETKLTSGVYLRNQNQAPVAVVDAAASGNRTFIFNASGSSDFEGRTLSFYWFAGTAPTLANIRCDVANPTGTAPNQTLWGASLVGTGITLTYQYPTSAVGTPQNMTVVACDPGFRAGVATKGVTP